MKITKQRLKEIIKEELSKISEDKFDDDWRAGLPDVSKAAETERAWATPAAKEERLKRDLVRRILELMPSLLGSEELLMKKKLGDLQQMARSLGGN